MVLTAAPPRLAPAFVVPDEQSWALWGPDPAAAGLRPVLDPGAVTRVLAPERVPEELREALAGVLAASPRLPVEGRPSPLAGVLATEVVRAARDPAARAGDGGEEHGGAHAGQGEDGGGEDHGDGGHEDHGDMMAIEGEPSADGLVMEPIELELGPLGSPLPGGIVVAATLDGDVVAACEVRATLRGGAGGPDPLSPAAWREALARAGEPERERPARWAAAAAVERERAVSHLAWLRALGRLLGFEPLVTRASAALAGARAGDAAEARALAALVAGRRLAARTAGRATVDAAAVRERGLRGPTARAAGIPDDARVLDPLYVALGFDPVLEEAGDARARALVRAREAVASLELAAAAAERAPAGSAPEGGAPPGAEGLVEGPRGPLRAWMEDGRTRTAAPGGAAARAAAADAATGEEWAGALVALASFDLSPWEVAG